MSNVRHPRTGGLTERVNETMQTLLRLLRRILFRLGLTLKYG